MNHATVSEAAVAAAVARLETRAESAAGPVLFRFYRWRVLRPLVRRVLQRLEGSPMVSRTWRRILLEQYGIKVGRMSRGAGLKPGILPHGTVVGHFTCLAAGLEVLRRNHTANRFSQHPLFFNKVLGLLREDSIPPRTENPLVIGSDVWFGMRVLVTPGCRNVGDGAIIGAGSVVTKDVAPFTVVAGNPARVIRKRFAPEVEQVIAASQWWLRPLPEILRHAELFTQGITEETLAQFAAAFPPVEPRQGAAQEVV